MLMRRRAILKRNKISLKNELIERKAKKRQLYDKKLGFVKEIKHYCNIVID